MSTISSTMSSSGTPMNDGNAGSSPVIRCPRWKPPEGTCKKALKDWGWASDHCAQMAMEAHRGHHLKRIVLPSGKTIEVVYFDQVDRPAEQAEAAQPQRTERELHVCEECGS